MIVRILGEGQFDVPDTALDELNELDEALVTAVEAGDSDAFGRALGELLTRVRTAATPHAADALDSSDLILPGSDSSLSEVQALLGDDGLIPG
ncbi:MAG: PspA-associated protein PspAA [Pseudonocardiaceae bacterium]